MARGATRLYYPLLFLVCCGYALLVTSDDVLESSDPPSEIPSEIPSLVPTMTLSSAAVIEEEPSPRPTSNDVVPTRGDSTTFEPSSLPSVVTSAVPIPPSVSVPAISFAPTIFFSSSGPSTLRQCFDEEEALRRCYDDIGSRAQDCDACLTNNLPADLETCEEIIDAICSAIESCGDCNGCETRIEVYIDCLFQESANCPISCNFFGERRRRV